MSGSYYSQTHCILPFLWAEGTNILRTRLAAQNREPQIARFRDRRSEIASILLKNIQKPPKVTNLGTTPITILAVNSDHGPSFAGEETRTMVWVPISLQIYSTFEFWRFKFSVVWVLVWVSSFYGDGGGSRTVNRVNPKRGRKIGAARKWSKKCRKIYLTIFDVLGTVQQLSKSVENIFDTFWRFLPCAKNVENYFWQLLTWPLSAGHFCGPLKNWWIIRMSTPKSAKLDFMQDWRTFLARKDALDIWFLLCLFSFPWGVQQLLDDWYLASSPDNENRQGDIVARVCGDPLSSCTCHASRVAADFLRILVFFRCSSSITPKRPCRPSTARSDGRQAASETVSRYRGVWQLHMWVWRYTVQLCTVKPWIGEGGSGEGWQFKVYVPISLHRACILHGFFAFPAEHHSIATAIASDLLTSQVRSQGSSPARSKAVQTSWPKTSKPQAYHYCKKQGTFPRRITASVSNEKLPRALWLRKDRRPQPQIIARQCAQFPGRFLYWSLHLLWSGISYEDFLRRKQTCNNWHGSVLFLWLFLLSSFVCVLRTETRVL